MVWRGHQYERGIRRYVQKFGRYPTKIDDLVKATSGVRYMREAYKDPMNKEDGSWRFIYVTPAGALIGSVRYTSLVQMALMDKMAQAGGGAIPGMAGMPGESEARARSAIPTLLAVLAHSAAEIAPLEIKVRGIRPADAPTRLKSGLDAAESESEPVRQSGQFQRKLVAQSSRAIRKGRILQAARIPAEEVRRLSALAARIPGNPIAPSDFLRAREATRHSGRWA